MPRQVQVRFMQLSEVDATETMLTASEIDTSLVRTSLIEVEGSHQEDLVRLFGDCVLYSLTLAAWLLERQTRACFQPRRTLVSFEGT